jgi:hypothetical protein
MKICLYTAIFGDYETLKPPEKIDGLDYICFTDNPDLKSDDWKIIYIEKDNNVPPAVSYKKIKCLSHNYLPDYDYTIWLDANFVIKDKDYVNFLFKNFKSDKILLYKHFCLAGFPRNCIYQEGIYSLTIPKYSKEKILPQLNEYKNLHNYPENNGLYQSGFLLRNNRYLDVIEFNKLWFKEIMKFGMIYPQCQVSLPFTLWKLNISFNIIPDENIWNTQRYEITVHGNNEKFKPAYV